MGVTATSRGASPEEARDEGQRVSPGGRSLADLCSWPIVMALLVRLGLIIFVLTRHPERNPDRLFWTADSEHYLDLASSLLHGRFSATSGPEIFRPPGYPLFLAPGVALGYPTAFALVAQSLLCCVLVVLVVGTARRIGLGDRPSSAAGVLCALEPTLLLWSLLLMADTLLGVMVGATLLALIAHLRDRSSGTLLLATMLAAGSALVKPVAYGLVLVVAFIVSLAGRRAQGGLAALRLFLGVAFCGVLIVSVWDARNGFGAVSGFSTQLTYVIRSADFEIWRLEHPQASAEAALSEWRRLGLDNPEGISRSVAIDAPSPLRRVGLHLRGVFRTLSNPGVLTWLEFLDLEPVGMSASLDLRAKGAWRFFIQSIKDRPRVVDASVLLGILNLAYWGLFVVGFRKLMHRDKAVALAAGLFIAYFAFAAGGPWGQSRFRIPFVSALCVIAATAFDRGAGRPQGSKATPVPPQKSSGPKMMEAGLYSEGDEEHPPFATKLLPSYLRFPGLAEPRLAEAAPLSDAS